LKTDWPPTVAHSDSRCYSTACVPTAVPHGARCIVLQKNFRTIFFKKEERKMKKIPSAASGAKYRASNEN
jgi:hypothetical protein